MLVNLVSAEYFPSPLLVPTAAYSTTSMGVGGSVTATQECLLQYPHDKIPRKGNAYMGFSESTETRRCLRMGALHVCCRAIWEAVTQVQNHVGFYEIILLVLVIVH